MSRTPVDIAYKGQAPGGNGNIQQGYFKNKQNKTRHSVLCGRVFSKISHTRENLEFLSIHRFFNSQHFCSSEMRDDESTRVYRNSM